MHCTNMVVSFDPKMTLHLGNSSVYSEVALQLKSGDEESGTVVALDCGHWRCSLVALHSGCSKSLAAGVFKGGGSLTHSRPLQHKIRDPLT